MSPRLSHLSEKRRIRCFLKVVQGLSWHRIINTAATPSLGDGLAVAAAAVELDSPPNVLMPTPPLKEGFRRYRLADEVVRGGEGLGFLDPTPVQRRVIPLMLKGCSAFISAETGTGKTAAYALPLLELARRQVASEGARGKELSQEQLPQRPLVLVLTPTADLASQVYGHFVALGRFLPHVRNDLLTAASSADPASQLQAVLRRNAEVLIATPGRLVRLLKQAGAATSATRAVDAADAAVAPSLSLAGVRHWVVDECDRVARMGLLQDVKQLFAFLPRPPQDPAQQRMQVLLVSATLTPAASFLLRRFAPSAVSVDLNAGLQVAGGVKHVAYTVASRRKAALLEYLLKRKGSFRGSPVLVFTRTRQRAERLAHVLAERGIAAEAIHAGLTGTQRWQLVAAFKGRQFQCLVATDVLGRGIDIPDLPVVVNFDLPLSPEDYVHQVGRTGRAGQEGMAISLVSRDAQAVPIGGPHQTAVLWEERFLSAVESLLGARVERRKVPGPWRDVDWEQLDETNAGSGAERQGRRAGARGWLSRGSTPERAPQERSDKSRLTLGSGDGTQGARGIEDVVEGMERGLAQRAGIRRLRDVESKPRGRRKAGGVQTRREALK